MTERLATPDGAAAYRRRQQIVEPVFAHIKYLRGSPACSDAAKQAVQAEIDLIATTHNLLKLYRHPTPPDGPARRRATAPRPTPRHAPPARRRRTRPTYDTASIRSLIDIR